MAILHLQLDIDSDVLPELHAALTAVTKSLSRAERLRQLAATGLIWEHLRLHAVHSGVATPAPMVATAAGADEQLSVTAPSRAASRPVPPPSPPPPPSSTIGLIAPVLPLSGPYVDLDGPAGLDAAVPDLSDALPPVPMQPRPHAAPPLVLPVLDDVVEEDSPPADAVTVRALSGAEPAGRSRKAGAKTTTAPADHAPAAPAPRKASSRSRIARMQEKGLFKNGE